MIFVVLVVSSYLSGDSAIINRRTPFKRASATFVILIFVVPFAMMTASGDVVPWLASQTDL